MFPKHSGILAHISGDERQADAGQNVERDVFHKISTSIHAQPGSSYNGQRCLYMCVLLPSWRQLSFAPMRM
jgi:hypothetical protein